MDTTASDEKALTLADFLNSKMKAYKEKNPRFSFRSMAAKAGISPGAMNEILHGKRPLSAVYAERIAKGLNLPREEMEVLLSFASERRPATIPQCILTEPEVDLICNWESYAILSLLKVPDFQDDAGWISKRLGIEESRVTECIDILIKLQIVRRAEGKLERTKSSVTNAVDIPKETINKAHRGDLKKALEMLETTPVAMRDYSSITMAIDPAHIPDAKRMIGQFRRKLAALMERGETKEVYNLAIQLHPLTNMGDPS